MSQLEDGEVNSNKKCLVRLWDWLRDPDNRGRIGLTLGILTFFILIATFVRESKPNESKQSVSTERVVDGKIYLTLTPREMIESIEDMTGLQAKRFVDNTYKGKWMRVDGKILDVMGDEGSASLLFLEGYAIRIDLLQSEFQKATHLRSGDDVSAVGEFLRIEGRTLILINGAITD